jgi:hypothetical protein
MTDDMVEELRLIHGPAMRDAVELAEIVRLATREPELLQWANHGVWDYPETGVTDVDPNRGV